MSKKLLENIIHIDQIRINSGIEKVCKCENRKYMLDTTNKRVFCSSCGAMTNPYDAMFDMASRFEAINKQMDSLLEQRKQILDYKPWLLTIRDLESRYRGKKMLPCCPRCDEPFYLEELVSWMGKEFADARIKKWKSENRVDD